MRIFTYLYACLMYMCQNVYMCVYTQIRKYKKKVHTNIDTRNSLLFFPGIAMTRYQIVTRAQELLISFGRMFHLGRARMRKTATDGTLQEVCACACVQQFSMCRVCMHSEHACIKVMSPYAIVDNAHTFSPCSWCMCVA